MSRKYFLPVLLIAQCILVYVGFQNHYQNPEDSLFYDLYDGFKNYHTLYTYVSQDRESSGILHYDGMNYPYGEFVTYTDNTPILAIPMKVLVKMGVEPGPWILWLFNQCLILGVLLSTLLLFFILKSFLKSDYLIGVGALTLPWINPQLIRLSNGHFNLSQSWLLLLPLFLLLLYIKRVGSERSRWPVELALLGSLLLSTGYHLYYLPINGLIIGTFLVFHGTLVKQSLRSLISAVAIPLTALIVFVMISKGLDPYFDLRPDTHSGFNFEDWRLNLLALLTAYPHFGIDFIIQAMDHHHYESNSYLGGFTLYGLLLLIVSYAMKRVKPNLSDPFLKPFLWTAIICLITSLGTKFDVPSLGLHVENIVNPLFWLEKVSDKVEHFRCLARFNWPFFWAVNFIMLYILDQQIKRENVIIKVVAFILPVLLLLDMKDAIRFNHSEAYGNVLTVSDTKEMNKLLQDVEPTGYEAIVPIPFYHVGSMQPSYTLDNMAYITRRASQLSCLTGLPLMACQMSRTPVEFAKKQFNIFKDRKQSALHDLESTKPVLVLADRQSLKTQLSDESIMSDDIRRQVIKGQRDLINTDQLELISSAGRISLYRWLYE